MLDILQSIMKLSNDKKDTLLYFLDDNTCDKVRRYQYVETKDLYLNNLYFSFIYIYIYNNKLKKLI